MSRSKKSENLDKISEKEYEAQLIAHIANKPFLYNKEHENYSQYDIRKNAWQEIGEDLNKSVKELKKKWQTLRDTYRKFYRKSNNVDRKDDSTKWIHYESMKFINGHIKLDETSESCQEIKKYKEFDIKLIKEVSTGYKKWDEISEILNVSVEFCKKRWNCLHTIFKKFYKREIEQNKKTSWAHYESLKFLINHVYSHRAPDMEDISSIVLTSFQAAESSSKLDIIKLEKQLENINVEEYQKTLKGNNLSALSQQSFEFNNLPPTTDILVKSEEINCMEYNNVLQDDTNPPLFSDIQQKCGEIFITKTKKFSYKCCICDNILKEINDFTKHVLETHIGRNEINSTDIFENSKYKNSYFNDTDDLNLKKNVTETNEIGNHLSEIEKLKNIKTKIKQTIDSLVNVKDDPKMKTLQRFKKRFKKDKIGKIGKYPCSKCFFSFDKEENLKKHEKSHKRKRRFHKKEKADFEITEDIKIAKTYQCEECGKYFPRHGSLRRHRSTWHMDKNDRPYKCLHCTKSFCTLQNLKCHIYTHTGEKPYECSICNLKFTKSWNLNEHMKIHSGKKNYVCEICGKDFFQSSVLIKHKKKHERKNDADE